MSLSDILGSALSGLNAAQAGLRSASNNIANVNTPGYAREKVALQPGVTAGRVSGVLVSQPQRVADRFLEANVYRRAGDWGSAEVVANYLDRLQSLLGAPGDPAGLPARVDAIGAAAIGMTGGGGEQTIRAFTESVDDALFGLRQLDEDLAQLRADAATEVGSTLGKINDLLRRVHTLNDTVARQAALGRATGGATDLRMSAVEELAGLMKVSVREQPDGRLTVETASGVPLVDRRLRQFDAFMDDGAAQPAYAGFPLRFMDADGELGAVTGDKLDPFTLGGKLGGLLDLRDRQLPGFQEQLRSLASGLAETLNRVSNEGTGVPAPRQLSGTETGLIGSDRLGFSGKAVFAIIRQDGVPAASTTIDFAALGPTATMQDAVDAINAGLGAAGSAALVDGKLTITATNPNDGMAIAQDPANPSARAGLGFSQFFGLNDLITGMQPPPAGLIAADVHGFESGQTVHLAMRDGNGRTLAEQTLSPATGGTVGDLLAELNSGPLSALGSFGLDGRGRLSFSPAAGTATAGMDVINDSTDRLSTGRTFSSLFGLDEAQPLLSFAVRADIRVNPQRLPLARLKTDASTVQPVLGQGDLRGAAAFVDQLRAPHAFRDGRTASLEGFATSVLGGAGLDAADAADRLADREARRTEAINRRDSYSAVNIDEELSQLVVLQNSYSASARVMTTATQMYDTLLDMVK